MAATPTLQVRVSRVLILHPLIAVLIGGLAAALMVAIPLVDDGLRPSEVLTMVLAFIAGSGLTMIVPTEADKED